MYGAEPQMCRGERGMGGVENRFSTSRSCPWKAKKHLEELFYRHRVFLAGVGWGGVELKPQHFAR